MQKLTLNSIYATISENSKRQLKGSLKAKMLEKKLCPQTTTTTTRIRTTTKPYLHTNKSNNKMEQNNKANIQE